jgi:diguanylate cyclase (GGDEF)-like protein
MPDYNRRATAYWWTAAPLGLLAIAWAFADLATGPWQVALQIGAGVVMAGVAGIFPIRIPRTKTSFAVGDVFTFLLLFTHGVGPAVLAAAAESAAASAMTSKRWTSRIGGPALSAISMTVTGMMMQWMVQAAQGPQGVSVAMLTVIALWVAIVHFVINTILVAALPRLKRGEWLRWGDVTGSFGLTLVVSALCACTSAILSESFRDHTLALFLTVTPPLVMLLTVVRGYVGQQEAHRALSEAEAQAARREAEITTEHLKETHHIAFHDALTGLPNRRMLLDELAKSVGQAQADPGRSGCVLMFLDFDRFKLINDTLGHAAGDRFLIMVAERLVGQMRPGDLVARLGGDEFAVLLRSAAPREVVEDVARRIQDAVRKPYLVEGNELASSASIGITSSEHGYDNAGDMLRDADIAMYRAKAAGKARHVVFDATMHADVARKMRQEAALRRAVADGSLQVSYQPIFNLPEQRLIGFEALARWHHPEFGDVDPQEFIALAEESSLVLDITDLVLTRACTQLHRWQGMSPAWSDLEMRVNIADKDIAQRNLLPRVKAALQASGLQPSYLTLELTEGIIMRRLATERGALEELRAFGLRLSIDDFGMGYSSLAHLSSLPIDSLKIDRSFVADLFKRDGGATIVRTILGLGRSLGMQVVAEGIETPAQLDWLLEAGCLIGQGRQLAHPLDAPAVERLLAELADLADLAAPALPALPSAPGALLH